jgi:hypothetical protein
MPRGGARRGAGRPRGAASKLTREVADAAAAAGCSPLDYMLRALADPTTKQSRRDRMAEMCAPFCHPKLNAVAATIATPPVSGDPVIINVFGVPRGCQIDASGSKIIWPDGSLTDPPPLEPYAPTPDWTQPALTRQRAEPVPFETVEAEVPENVTQLHPYQRRHSSDDEGPAGAA